jgi:integron integrase
MEPAVRQPKLLDRVRSAIRTRHYSRRTEDAYAHWIRAYIVFHGKRHPESLGAGEVSAFVSWLAEARRVSASTQNQALSAVLFLYRHVLGIELHGLPQIVRARTPERLPVVLSREEVMRLLGQLSGTMHLVVTLLYGAGLRLEECLELRIKDIDFERQQVIVRSGKGQKDRVTVLPAAATAALRVHLDGVRRVHEGDLAKGLGRVVLPFAVARKSPSATTDWRWQFVSRRRGSAAIGVSVRRRGIACTSRRCRRLWPMRHGRRGSSNASGRTRCGTASRLTSWRPATTFALCRSSWAIETFGRR